MSSITDHQIVSREDWIAQRKALLAKEKEFNRDKIETAFVNSIVDPRGARRPAPGSGARCSLAAASIWRAFGADCKLLEETL